MPKVVNVKKMKLELFEAFKQCINTRPVLDVTMREIAKQAGVTHPTVLKYFPDKSDFIKLYIDSLVKEYMDLLTKLYNSKKRDSFDLQVFLRDLTVLLFDIDGKLNCDDKILQIYTIAQTDATIKEYVEQYYEYWIEFIRSILIANDIDNSMELANTIFMILEGVFIIALNTSMTVDDALRMCNKIRLVE